MRGALLLILICVSLGKSFASTLVDPKKPDDLRGSKPNTFVSHAPLVVAAVCADGVVLVATHPPSPDFDLGGDDDEVGQEEIVRTLPSNYVGPLRIHAIDGFGSAIATCGWKADGELLATMCRAIAAEELDRLGSPSPSIEYGNLLVRETSYWMAQCEVSQRRRGLSCVCLMATAGSKSTAGFLWLVDATGHYRVRACAVGKGAKEVNKRLRKLNFATNSSEICVEKLVHLLVQKHASEEGKETKKTENDDNDEEGGEWTLPPRSRVEVGLVTQSTRKLLRIKQPFGLSSKTKPS